VTIQTWAAYEEAGLLFRGSSARQGMATFDEATSRLFRGDDPNGFQLAGFWPGAFLAGQPAGDSLFAERSRSGVWKKTA